MTPILFESSATEFNTNGICRLRDVLTCTVTEERNGVFECDFTYPVNGANFDEIKCGRIVGVIHSDAGDIQPFEIVSMSRPLNGIVSFHAVHISYRQSQITVAGSNINSLAEAFALLATAEPSNPFTYWTNKTVSGFLAAADGTPRSVRQMLGGVTGSILGAYGGEFEWDGFTVKLWESRGQTRDFAIRYGVNLLEYSDETDYQGTFTSCTAFWKSNDGEIVTATATLQETGYNGRDIRVPLDLTEKFEEKPTAADLQAAALVYMRQNQTQIPSQNIKVDFVRLEELGEFDQFENLLTCNLCDRIKVIFPMYNVEADFKIVRTVWDVLESRYTEMELGALSTSLSEALGISGSNVTITSEGGGDTIKYGVCSTAQGTAAKTVTVSPALEALEEGELIFVKFNNSNTASNPTLNVNGLGAKTIRRYGTTSPSTSAASSWNAGSVVALVYDGTTWQMVGWINTTYSSMTVAEYEAGTSGTARLITPARLKGAIQYWMEQPTITTFTPQTGSTATGQTCYYAKIGSVVTLNVAISGLTANSSATILTLPEGYRPSSKVTAAVQAGARTDFCSLEISTAGVVTIATHTTRTSAIGLVTFIAE